MDLWNVTADVQVKMVCKAIPQAARVYLEPMTTGLWRHVTIRMQNGETVQATLYDDGRVWTTGVLRPWAEGVR